MNKVYCGTAESILEQLRKDLDFQPMEARYLPPDQVRYPFNSDGLSGCTFAEQLAARAPFVSWMEFIRDETGDVFGTLNTARVRILKEKAQHEEHTESCTQDPSVDGKAAGTAGTAGGSGEVLSGDGTGGSGSSLSV